MNSRKVEFNASIKPFQARYSPIAPITLLEQLQRSPAKSSYLLLLIHDVINNVERYRAVVEAIPKEKRFIIMDNSAVELGEAVSLLDPSYADVLKDLHVDCIVMPDAIGDAAETLRLLHNTLKNHRPNIKFMCVPQGKDANELIECIETMRGIMMSEQGECLWGVPRILANTFGSRIPALTYINNMADTPSRIHLLGMSRNFGDDIRATSMHNVMGIDSANPIVLGQRQDPMMKYQHVDRGDYWDHTTLELQSVENALAVHMLLKDVHPGE